MGRFVGLVLAQRYFGNPFRPATSFSDIGGGERSVFGDATYKTNEKKAWKPFEVDTIDPAFENLPVLKKAEFSYGPNEKPRQLVDLDKRIRQSDAIVVVSPEYNHAPGPALLNFIDHFGGSAYANKPSCIVTYSAGQWGGVRAAMQLRPILSEMGCLPVSAMLHFPKAQDVFTESGFVVDEKGDGKAEERMMAYVNRAFFQLWWWAEAARYMRSRIDPAIGSPAFVRDPSQRDGPS